MKSSIINRFWMITLVAALTVGAIVLTANNLGTTQAQNDTKTLRTLFERIDLQIKNNQDFLVAIQFQTPIVENKSVWVIPDSREKSGDEVSVYIGEIGDDYVCFDALRGSARYFECTPYSNIVSIRYLSN